MSVLADVLFQEEFSDGANPAREISQRNHLSGRYSFFVKCLGAYKCFLLARLKNLAQTQHRMIEEVLENSVSIKIWVKKLSLTSP